MRIKPKNSKQNYELADVAFPNTGKDKAAGNAGEARRSADQGPGEDRDRWAEFSKTTERERAREQQTG